MLPEKDMMTEETRRAGIVDKDGVHPTEKANRNAAVSLCAKLAGRKTGAADGRGLLKRAKAKESTEAAE